MGRERYEGGRLVCLDERQGPLPGRPKGRTLGRERYEGVHLRHCAKSISLMGVAYLRGEG